MTQNISPDAGNVNSTKPAHSWMSRGARLSIALVALGLVGGAVYDRMPERPVSMRLGYRVLQGDFHAHTRLSDGFLSPFDVVIHAKRRGLDVIGVTEHNHVSAGKLARGFGNWVTGMPTVVVGEEVTFKSFHLIALGLHTAVSPFLPLNDVVDQVHAQGGVAIAAHPVGMFWNAYEEVRPKLDGTELMHPLAYAKRPRNGWNWAEMRDFYLRAEREGLHMTPIGSSDYHAFSPLGICRTFLFTRGTSEQDVIESIRSGRTVVFDLEGRGYGKPELVEALKRDPIAVHRTDEGYERAGWLDGFIRVLAIIGLFGLVVFGRQKPANTRTATL